MRKRNFLLYTKTCLNGKSLAVVCRLNLVVVTPLLLAKSMDGQVLRARGCAGAANLKNLAVYFPICNNLVIFNSRGIF